MRKKCYNSSVLRLILALKMINFQNPELELSDQQIPGTHKFRTNIFRPTKFRTNKLPNQLISGFFAILTDLFWSGVWCFTVDLDTSSGPTKGLILAHVVSFSKLGLKWIKQHFVILMCRRLSLISLYYVKYKYVEYKYSYH